MTLDRTFVECSILGFQAVIATVLTLTCLVLWRRQHGLYFLTWAAAWAVYVIRLAAISAFIVRRNPLWLFIHQVATFISAGLLLAAAREMSTMRPWRVWHLSVVPLALAWSWYTIYGVHSMLVAGISSVIILSLVTGWTGVELWKQRDRVSHTAARVLGTTFIIWSLHHLDYPLVRAFGAGVLYGAFIDILCLVSIGLGMVFLVLGQERTKLVARTAELEQLTRLLLRAQEDERRRIARELHDEAGQVLSAVKIELDLDGRREASALVQRALAQVRDISNLLRPSVLDDLGLSPALRSLVDDFAARTRIQVHVDLTGDTSRIARDTEVVVYRVVQEALTNVARHARATEAYVRLRVETEQVSLQIEDNGESRPPSAGPHLGWLGMEERVSGVGGQFRVERGPTGGIRICADLPAGVPA